MRRRRNQQQKPLVAQTHAVAQKLAQVDSCSLAELRYVEIHFFDGQQWTMQVQWEQRVDGQWQPVPWTQLDY